VAGGVLEARVPGTGRDGGPTCPTVKDFEGWKPVKRKPTKNVGVTSPSSAIVSPADCG
jgi:hypothetical protein